jgi:hypothetical protein
MTVIVGESLSCQLVGRLCATDLEAELLTMEGSGVDKRADAENGNKSN